jgi:hypothetical protein
MRSPSLDWLHAKLDKHIRLVQSYTEIEDLAFIIKACRLKPYKYIFEKPDNKLVLHRWWFDEFGNSFKVIKNKRLLITYNDLRLDRQKIISTDLYYGLSLDRIAKMSKLVYLSAGKDDLLYEDCYLLTFLGIDDYLRSYLYMYGEWQQVSPLLLGMKHLKLLAYHKDIRYFLQLGNEKNSPLPCISGQTWISCLPPSNAFLVMLSKEYETILPLLKT